MKLLARKTLLVGIPLFFLYFGACTNSVETVSVTLPDTKAFRMTHNLELTDINAERALGNANKTREVNDLFANKMEYDFNYVAAGQTSPIIEFQIYSIITQDIQLESMAIVGLNYREFLLLEHPDFPAALGKSNTFKAKVMFTPRTSGQKKATLVLNSQSHGAFRVELSGNAGGSPELVMQLSRVEGDYSIPNKFTMRVMEPTKPLPPGQCPDVPQKFLYHLSNPTNVPLTVQSAKLDGTQAPLFKLSGANFPLTLGANGKAALTVELPGGQTEGNYAVDLKLESNDGNEAQYTIPIRTYVLPPVPCFQAAVTSKPGETPSYLPLYKKPRRALGMLAPSTSASYNLHLKNTGFAPLKVAPDKISYLIPGNPAPVSLSVQAPPTGIDLQPGQDVVMPFIVTSATQRVPFTIELRFTLAAPAADPAAPATEYTLATTLEGVVGTAAPAREVSNLSIEQSK